MMFMVKKFSADPVSPRQEKVSVFIHRYVSTLIINKEFDYISSIDVSVMSVSISPDLKNASIYVSLRETGHGKNRKTKQRLMHYLHKISGIVRTKLAKEMKIRSCPKITFIEDLSVDYTQEITQLLKK